jgi:ethanolamine ammonia-lyase small subunit
MQERLLDLGTSASMLYALYAKAGGDRRTIDSLEDEGRRRLAGVEARFSGARLDAIYANARQALYAVVDDAVIRDTCGTHVRVCTTATDREDYLAHPPSGERVRRDDERVLTALYSSRRPQVQIVVSDGLNANAVNEQLRALLPPLRRLLADAGCDVGEAVVVVRNGRVRAGYHVGAFVLPSVIVHILGERPGTGLNTVSAYLTYGRDEAGRPRWDSALDHSCTTAVCGIHPKGKRPGIAADEIAHTVGRIVEQRRSGVALR